MTVSRVVGATRENNNDLQLWKPPEEVTLELALEGRIEYHQSLNRNTKYTMCPHKTRSLMWSEHMIFWETCVGREVCLDTRLGGSLNSTLKSLGFIL